MPKDTETYIDFRKVIRYMESVVAINRALKSTDSTPKERKALLQEGYQLVRKAQKELERLPPPPNSPQDALYLAPYLDELIWERDYYKKPIKDPVLNQNIR